MQLPSDIINNKWWFIDKLTLFGQKKFLISAFLYAIF